MKHITDISIEISELGDRYVAEILDAGNHCVEAVLSPVIRGSFIMTEDAARHFALKHFCAEIGDTLRAHLEQICTQ